MACSRAVAIATVLLACFLLAAPIADSAIVCGQVLNYVYPCIPYVRGPGGPVPAACCSGLRRLNSAARTTADRRTVCRCLKTASQGVAGVKPGLVSGLPGKCGIFLPFPISSNTDCSQIK